jgi:putative endonuclease
VTAKRPSARLKAPKVIKPARGWRVALGKLSHRLGHRSEWLAAALLMLRGYQILGFRLKTRAGEIDILARRGRVLAALGPDQYRRLLAAGQAVLRQRPSLAGHLLRIDIVALAPRRFPRHRRGVNRGRA